ncbi:MAG: glycoside hydrolase family 130 protein [Terricaulis sp.]
MALNIHNFDLRLTPDPARVVVRPFHIAPDTKAGNENQSSRAKRIVEAVLQMSEDECARNLAVVDADFDARHWQTEAVYIRRYEQVAKDMELQLDVGPSHRELIGAYFCHEYSYAAAAIMNPSVVPHPDQSGMRKGEQRFVMSLRTVGEGHISSIAFREGILSADGDMTLWPQPSFSIAAESKHPQPEGAFDVERSAAAPISGTVLFPFTRAQRNGLEDCRLVRFVEDDGRVTYFGTYTAYSGVSIGSELLETDDFSKFRLSPMRGSASHNKGMAFFPRRIGGDYAVIGRQDGESLFFMRSADKLDWNGGEKILAPKFAWELVQIGNCGSPIELDEGWLMLTHGVGAMRKYSIGAVLLDKSNPTKVLGRTAKPLLSPSHENREGYVPNVLYTCGAMQHGDWLFLPYGIADSAVSFAMVELRSLLAELS